MRGGILIPYTYFPNLLINSAKFYSDRERSKFRMFQTSDAIEFQVIFEKSWD